MPVVSFLAACGFNPRTRVGCEVDLVGFDSTGKVSIHAPVWGANVGCRQRYRDRRVSIHAPVWGANHPNSNGRRVKSRFNPRTRVGCEHLQNLKQDIGKVSIHAPVWGAKVIVIARLTADTFQSTHPCGVRKRVAACHQPVFGFNPRTRVGCELSRRRRAWHAAFQSTHPCGVRIRIVGFKPLPPVSIHAPVWGAKGGFILKERKHGVSIHAPVWGAKIADINQPNQLEFQSTHPCGVRKASS